MVSGRTNRNFREQKKTQSKIGNLDIYLTFFLNWYQFSKFPVSNNSQSNKLVYCIKNDDKNELFDPVFFILVKPCSCGFMCDRPDRRHRLESDIAAVKTPWLPR